MTEPKLPTSTIELLDEIGREWSALLAVVDRITPAQMTLPDAGGWAPKDNLAHLTEWMKILLGYYMDKRPAAEVTGLPPEVLANWDFQVVNAHFFERNRNRPTPEILAGLKHVYAEVTTRLAGMPFEAIEQPLDPADPQRGLLLGSIRGNTSEHFAEHRLTLEKNLQ